MNKKVFCEILNKESNFIYDTNSDFELQDFLQSLLDIYVEEKFPNPGVAIYALMAAGGDLGASVAPQLVGVLSDKIAVMGLAEELAQKLSITAEQVGIRAGMLAASVFPLLGVVVILVMKSVLKKDIIP